MSNKLSTRGVLTGLLAVAQLALSYSVAIMPAYAADEKSRPHIDLAFCIDTTGSMQSEIDNVKSKTKEIVAKIAGGHPSPVVRVGLVAYRDRGDAYVTKVFPFTENIDKMVKDISSLQADGGGDTPEAVNQALHASVHDLSWSDDKKTLKLLFLIGDAGPKHYAGDYDWHSESKDAISRGIQINTIGCQGLETNQPAADGVDVFKEIAHLADGKFEALSYRHEVADASGRRTTVISSGGAVYKVAGADKDWREGAATLAARGKAMKMDVAAERSMSFEAATAPASAFDSLTRSRAVGAPMAMRASSIGGSLDSRNENNLSDIVLDAAKNAAKKRLNLDFKDK